MMYNQQLVTSHAGFHAEYIVTLIPRVPILATVAQEQLEATSAKIPRDCTVSC